ncbi:MAG: cytochrome P450 [Flavobacteriaceae bacterium]|nr:cytochrome P450 [Flavobacteriaceae bacterium]
MSKYHYPKKIPLYKILTGFSALAKNPEDFIPERFSEQDKKEMSSYYFPFGAGPRLCIGNSFALYEMVLAVQAIVGKFHIETNSKHIELSSLITLKPVGVKLKFTARC